MISFQYVVKVRSAHHFNVAPPQFMELQDRAAQEGLNPPLHKFATYLWGGGGLFFYDFRTGITQHSSVAPVETIGPRCQTLILHVDPDGCPVELYAATKSGPQLGYTSDGNPLPMGLYYLGQLRPGQVTSFRLNGLHGIVGFCNDPTGSDSKVTCSLVTDPNP